jgi:hypothetical protein
VLKLVFQGGAELCTLARSPLVRIATPQWYSFAHCTAAVVLTGVTAVYVLLSSVTQTRRCLEAAATQIAAIH